MVGWGGLQTVRTQLHTSHHEGKLLLPHSASSLLLQVVLSLACLALASAAPQQPYVDPEAGVPKPYSYAYAVADDYSKANFQKTESQDSNVRISRNMPLSCSEGIVSTCQLTYVCVSG